MQTRVSAKGQVVIPSPLRRKLGIHAGDPLEIQVEDGIILLKAKARPPQKVQIVIDPVSGLPSLTAGPDAPRITNAMVEAMLADFP